MVVHDLNIPGIPSVKTETQAPLIVDANTVLSFAVTLQGLKAVIGRNTQIVKARSTMQYLKFSLCY